MGLLGPHSAHIGLLASFWLGFSSVLSFFMFSIICSALRIRSLSSNLIARTQFLPGLNPKSFVTWHVAMLPSLKDATAQNVRYKYLQTWTWVGDSKSHYFLGFWFFPWKHFFSKSGSDRSLKMSFISSITARWKCSLCIYIFHTGTCCLGSLIFYNQLSSPCGCGISIFVKNM